MELTKSNLDINEYGEKYNFYYNSTTESVVCTTTYKGHIIRGIAKCDPEDIFDLAVGKRLAYLRCKKKFAKRKFKHARKVYEESVLANARSMNNMCRAQEFMEDSEIQLEAANTELLNFELELK